MSVFALGLNHHTAPLDLRGRFAFTLEPAAWTAARCANTPM
jgi:glutamyl-tRNA reductase